MDNASDMITVVEPDLTIVFQAASGARLLGHCPEELEGTKFGLLVDPYGLTMLRRACGEAADGVAHRPVALRLQHKDGSWIDGETLVRYDLAEGCLILTTRDIRERTRIERQLRRRAEQQSVVVRIGERALAGEELPQLMRRASSEVAGALGAEGAAVLRYVPERDVFAPYAGVGSEPYASLGSLVGSRRSQPGLTLVADGPVIVRDWSAESRFDEASTMSVHGMCSGITVPIPGSSAPFGVICVQSTQSNRFNYEDGVFLRAVANVLAGAIARSDGEERIRYLAMHDPVTGLPNRMLFEDRLRRALATAARHNRRLAMLFLDLDNFKRVNDSLGHAIGDVMLKAAAERLASCLRAEDTLARFGGDEFAVLLPEVDVDEDATAVVQRITDALRDPLNTGTRQIITSASIGVAIAGGARQDEDEQTLIRDADLAMYAAKQRGPGGWELFAEHMYDTAVRRLDLTGDLYQAADRGELEVFFQPIVALAEDEIVGMEALVRWNHPRHGLLPPAAFLPLAEETGLIVALGRFVLHYACETLRRWQLADSRHQELYVSVNFGAQELAAPDLVRAVKTVLTQTGLNPSSLILEMTEDVLLSNDASLMSRLRELKSLGVRLAVDDFGTGYSALSHLQRFPVDIIKIDKTFIDGLGDDSEQGRLVRGIIELAHALNLETVAEGIERAEQADALRAMRSELGQGFHFARPLPTRDMDALLAASQTIDRGMTAPPAAAPVPPPA